jgi:hypothetical protein
MTGPGPAARRTRRASEAEVADWTNPSEDSRSHTAVQPIRADIDGDARCSALGTTARGSAPVLKLCRLLLKQAHDPARPLHAFRGNTLALIIRSLGEVAGLEISGNGVGFRRRYGVGTPPPVRKIGRGAP